MPSDSKYLFLSYCHENTEEVSKLRNELIAAGENLWWDQDIMPGQDQKHAILWAMRQSYAVILCLSSESERVSKLGIYPDAMSAIEAYRQYKPGSGFLFPVRLSECEIPLIEIDATRMLDRLKHVDLFPESRRAEGLIQLIEAIRRAPEHPQKELLESLNTMSIEQTQIPDKAQAEQEARIALGRDDNASNANSIQTEIDDGSFTQTAPSEWKAGHNNFEVVGFDLGHGETSIAWASLIKNTEPMMLELDGKRTQITAIGKHPDLGFIVGDAALNLQGVKDLRIGFKQIPTKAVADYEETLSNFMATYCHLLMSRGLIRGGAQSYFFVGCPSGWKEEEVSLYEQTLKSAGVTHLKVVRESRAALLQAKEAGIITVEQLKASVVVIDVGSSTIDVTHVIGGLQDEALDLGADVGATIIENSIFKRAVDRSTQRDELIRFFSNAGNRHIKTQCEISCREAKEAYWRNETAYKSYHPAITHNLILEDKFSLQIKVDAQEMEEILNAALPELNGKSWIEAFRDVLRQTKNQLGQKDITPGAVVLTGGASRMSFIEQLCREQFGESDFIRYPSPEETVALGLARWGQLQMNTSAFSQEIEHLCNHDLPELILSYKDSFTQPLVQEITDGIIQSVVEPILKKWREGEIKTLKEIDSKILTEIEVWFLSEGGQRAIAQALSKILKPISSEINNLTSNICHKYAIPHSSLRLNVNIKSQDYLTEINVNKPFEGGVAITGGITIILIFILTGALKMAAATGGPVGWLFLIIMSLWGSLIGTTWLDEKIKEADISVSIRKSILSESKIKKSLDSLKPKLREKFEEALSGSQLDNLIHVISSQIKDALNERANEVKWIIS